MSGIAGIYNLDGRPVDRAQLNRMTDVIAHRGPDDCGYWLDGPVGLGHRMLYSTPESLHEKQPAAFGTGGLVVTADARIDNRDELIASLHVNGKAKERITDVELILSAYKKWGEQCPQRLVGDFAFVIWDGSKRQLFCARDALGIKPFYYYSDGRKFLFGSELHQLFADSSILHEPNDGMIAEYLACALTSHEETLYRGILRLTPGHSLVVGPRKLKKARYWDIDPSATLKYKSDDEYAEHFLTLFKVALRACLRSHRPVGVYLSGGLDSSSVAGLTQSLYQEGALPAPGFETFSLVFPGLACDESAYIEEVVKLWDLKCNLVSPEPLPISQFAEQACRYHDFPNYPNAATFDPLMTMARAKGIRVLLTGLGGDEWLTGSYYHYADLLRSLKLRDLIRQLRFDSRVPRVIFPSLPVFRVGLWPLIPQGVRRVVKKVLRRNSIPPWVDPQFARRSQLTRRLQEENSAKNFTSFAQRDLYRTLTSGWNSHLSETEDRFTSWVGLEQRHPLNDRRIVEFAFALPEEQRWRGDEPKYVLRRAMANFLPEVVRQRRTKADFSHTFAEALKAAGGESLFDSLAIVSMGWVNRACVRQMYQQMERFYSEGDEHYSQHVWTLWMIFGIDLWFKSQFLNRNHFTKDASQSGGRRPIGLARNGGKGYDTNTTEGNRRENPVGGREKIGREAVLHSTSVIGIW